MEYKSKTRYIDSGHINCLIGGFLLLLQGFLTFFNAIGTAIASLSLLGLLAPRLWLAALLMILIGALVLLLVWEWIIDKTNFRITNDVLKGVIILILGIIAGSVAGLLIIVGGILYIIGGY